MDEMKFDVFLQHVLAVSRGSQEDMAVLKTTGYLEEGQGSLAGFTVPSEASERIMQIAMENSIVRSDMPPENIIPMTTDSITISRIVDSSHASTLLGGVTASWTAEQGDLSESNPAIGALTLNARKLTGLCYTSNEWLDDTIVPGEELLTAAFGKAIAFYSDDKYINGSGVNEPLGFVNASCTISQSAEQGQQGDTIKWTNMVNMDARLIGSGSWLMNPDIKPMIYNGDMSIPAGLISSDADGVYIIGHRVVPTEKCATLGTAGDLILANVAGYVIGDRGLLIAASSEEPTQYIKDNTAWRFILRTDGQPIPTTPITPKNGTTTRSPYLILASRT